MTTAVTKPIKVLLVDDHMFVRDGFRRMLDRTRDIKVVEEAEDGEQALKKYSKKKIDIVVMDLSMPKKGGVDTIEEMLKSDPEAKIIVFSMLENMVLITRLYQLGIRGYLPKSEATDDLIKVIREVMTGGIYFSDSIAREIALYNTKQTGHPKDLLTPREYDVFKQVAVGNDTKEIANHLDLNIKTVQHYTSSILNKLKMKSPAEVARLAIQLGIMEP